MSVKTCLVIHKWILRADSDIISGIILRIFDLLENVFYRSIDKEIHIKPSAQEITCKLCLQETKGIKEAFEEKSKLFTAHYNSGKVIYNSCLIIH